jgi:hypothetical protein
MPSVNLRKDVSLRRHAWRLDRRRILYVVAKQQLAATARRVHLKAQRLAAQRAAAQVTYTAAPATSAPSTPPPPATPSSGEHIALWECIHSGEGAWNSDTGNGYFGGLQMTYGWDGLVGNAALLSPAAQMQAAETGYRQSGYSIAWLEGQWPHTSPPCLGYA